MLAFILNYLGMLALGLSLEAMITLLTPKYIPYFLFILVGLDFTLGFVKMHLNSLADHIQHLPDAAAAGAAEPLLLLRARISDLEPVSAPTSIPSMRPGS